MKGIYRRPESWHTLWWETESLPLDQEQDKDVHSDHFYFILYWKLRRDITLEKEIESVHIGKKEENPSLFIDDMVQSIENPNNLQETCWSS